MNAKEFFYEFGKLIYQIDGIYEKYSKNNKVNAHNLLWILYSLNDGKEHSQRQICDDWLIPRSTANSIIKELEEKGYVSLYKIKGKRRELNICLTKTGQEYANNILDDLYNRENEAYKSINNPKEILDILRKMILKLQIIAKNN